MNQFDTLFPDVRKSGSSNLIKAQLVMLRILKVVDYVCRKHGISYWLCSGTLLGAVRHSGFIPWDDDLDIAMLRADYERFLEIAPQELPDDMFLQTPTTDPGYDSIHVPCKVRDTKSLHVAPYLAKKHYHKGIFIDVFPIDKFHKKGLKRFTEQFLKRTNNLITRCYDAEIEKHISFTKQVVALFRPCFKLMIKAYQAIVRPVIQKNKQLPDSECYMGHGFETPWIRSINPDDIFPLREIEFEGCMFFAPHNPQNYLPHIYGPDYMTPPPVEKRQPIHSDNIKPDIYE